VIVAKRAVEVSVCDRCGKEPANTWSITGPEGTPREIELCEQHGAPIANAYALARPVPKRTRQATRARTANQRPAAPVAVPQPEPIWR
jgi:hypothetical protein